MSRPSRPGYRKAVAGFDKDALGSWLSGPRAAAERAGVDVQYAGQRLGLPPQGRGAVTGWARRFAALFIDWLIALGITRVLFPHVDAATTTHNLLVLAVFAVHTGVLSMVAGASFGQRVMGLILLPVNGERPVWWRLLVRSLLVACVIPALLYDRDRRGLPDHVAQTVLVLNR